MTMIYRACLPLVMGGQPVPPRTQPLANETWKMYYAVGNRLVAMRVLTVTGSVLYYLHTDHLGSTSVIMDANGNKMGEMRYRPFGEIRYTWGISPTNIGFTGQRLDATGLMFYQARYYSQVIGRFVSADTIVPDFSNPQSLNRFSYVRNNPLKYIDPSGHREIECDPGDPGCDANGRLIKDKEILDPEYQINPPPPVKGQEGLTCSITAAYILLINQGIDLEYQAFINEFKRVLPQNGGFDPSCSNAGNPTCTSLTVIEEVVGRIAKEHGLLVRVTEGGTWASASYWIMSHVSSDHPVMINYGGGCRINSVTQQPERDGIGHSVVVFGYSLAQQNFNVINPMPMNVGSIGSKAFEFLKNKWANSDFGDPRRRISGTNDFKPYRFWALTVYRPD